MASAIDLTHSDDDDDDEVVIQGERQVEPRAARPAGVAGVVRPAAATASSSSTSSRLDPPPPASFAAQPSTYRSSTGLGNVPPPAFGVPSFGLSYDPRLSSSSSSSQHALAAAASTSSRQTLPPAYPLPPQLPSAYGMPSHASSSSSASSSSRARLPVPSTTSSAEVIDVDSLPDLPPPPPVAPRPAPPPENKPHLVGMLETSALIMYPDNPFLQPVIPPGQTLLDRLPKGEFMQQDGEEWARIKVKVCPFHYPSPF
jgi:hypothetical protein